MNYRADIDGLRALAVVPVMLFHAGVPGFTGGYVGVDVFFVISGFLITSMIAPEMRQGRFSIVTFYERRIRRILPASFAVLAFSSVAAWFILTPADLKDYGQSVLASAAFSSNILFWLQTGYFDGPAHMKPLLHTWSLAVEEQFYIVYPLLLGILMRFQRARVTTWLVGLLLLSLGAAIWTTEHDASIAFYHSPLRGWELLLGCLLALGAVPPITSPRLREAAAAAGLLLIALPVVAYGEGTTFPGLGAFAPCLGAGLIVHAGSGGRLSSVGRGLSRAPVVFVGKISYSLYLWHWPLLVFAGYLNVTRLPPSVAIAVLLVSFAAAALSWRYVEQPIRRGAVRRRAALFGAAAAATSLAIALGGLTHLQKGFPRRVKELVNVLDNGRNDRSPDRDRCHGNDSNVISFDDSCIYGVAGAAPTSAIWGDSFAAELAVALGERATQRGESMLYSSSGACPPAIGVFSEDRPHCEAHNAEVLAGLVAHPEIRQVVLVARYDRYFCVYGERYLDGLGKVASMLRDAGKHVVVTYPIPKPPGHVPTVLAQYAHAGRDPADATIERTAYDVENRETIAFLDRLTRAPAISAARPSDILCDAQRCALYKESKVLYFDENHLSLTGARYVLPVFNAALSDATP